MRYEVLFVWLYTEYRLALQDIGDGGMYIADAPAKGRFDQTKNQESVHIVLRSCLSNAGVGSRFVGVAIHGCPFFIVLMCGT